MKIKSWHAGALLMTGAAMVGAVGCMDGAPALDPAQVKSGIYSVYATTLHDSCTPKRPAGERGKTVVRVDGTAIKVNVAPLQDATGTYLSTPVSSFATEGGGSAVSEMSFTSVDPRCGEESMWLLTRELTSTEAGLLVRDLLDWSVGCPAAGAPPPGWPMPSLPSESCRSDQQMIFQLETVCEAPCEVHARGTGELYCSCADAI